jgi:hypothetical protein
VREAHDLTWESWHLTMVRYIKSCHILLRLSPTTVADSSLFPPTNKNAIVKIQLSDTHHRDLSIDSSSPLKMAMINQTYSTLAEPQLRCAASTVALRMDLEILRIEFRGRKGLNVWMLYSTNILDNTEREFCSMRLLWENRERKG